MIKKILPLALYLLLVIGVMFLTFNLVSLSEVDYIKKELNLDVSGCNIVQKNDSHGGFHGDGEYFLKAECSEVSNDMINQIVGWRKMPLSENLHIFMYGGKKGSMTYGFEAAKDFGIPEIENGYYFFIDRFDNNKNLYNDENLLARPAFNFTVALYDLDYNILYYYEIDT